MTKTYVWIFCAFLLGLSSGFIFSHNGRRSELGSAPSGSEVTKFPLSSIIVDPAAQDLVTRSVQSEESPEMNVDTNDTGSVRVPISLFQGVIQPAFFANTSTLSPISMIHFGLTAEEAQAFCKEAQLHVTAYQKLEAKHTELVEDPDGNVYFKVGAFADEANRQFNQLAETIANTFDRFGDDRGKVLFTQITESGIFEDKGRFEKEIFFSETLDPEGNSLYSFNLKYDHDRDPTAPGSWTLNDVKLMNVRHPELLKLVPEELR